MKKTMKYLAQIALVAMAIIMTGCQKEEPAGPSTEAGSEKTDGYVTYTTTVSIAETGATKALSEGGVKTFYIGDQIAVVYYTADGEKAKAVSGELQIPDLIDGGKSATFTVTLPSDVDKTKNVEYVYPASMANEDGSINWDALQTQNGQLSYLATNLDLCSGTASWTSEGQLPSVNLVNQIAICKFTIKHNQKDGEYDDTEDVTNMIVKNGANTYSFVGPILQENNYIYMAFRPGDGDFDFTIYCDGYCYKKTVTGQSLAASMIYPISLSLPERSQLVNLSELPSELKVLKVADGDVLTGTLATKTKIVVDEANNPTVTLQGVNITNLGEDCNWAGINCLDNTTLKIEGKNFVKAGGKDDNTDYYYYPGIYIKPGKTLTITGGGWTSRDGGTPIYEDELTATGNTNGGAGIGGGYNISCGNIVIRGGHIIAQGGFGAAGIGAGAGVYIPQEGTQVDVDVACGDITLRGADPYIQAYGGANAAGIGSGFAMHAKSQCGTIDISCYIVEAYGGENGAGIGTGYASEHLSSCQKIYFSNDGDEATGRTNFVEVLAVGGNSSLSDVGRGRGAYGDGDTDETQIINGTTIVKKSDTLYIWRTKSGESARYNPDPNITN